MSLMSKSGMDNVHNNNIMSKDVITHISVTETYCMEVSGDVSYKL